VDLYQDGDASADLEEAENLMRQVPKLTKKIAGKSLPIEVSFSLHTFWPKLTTF
jgi:hypothetical protein